MFYNTELLTSRKGGWGLFWLAATVGSKGLGAVRKLSKKELLGCNIIKACEKVVHPDEPLALRLSANLLYGISRVFSHKYAIHAGEVQHVHQALRKVINEAALAMPDITLAPELPLLPTDEGAPAPTTQAKETGIDLQLNPHAVLDMEFDWELGLDWELPGAQGPAGTKEAPFDEPVFMSPVQSIFGSPAPQAQPAGAHQAREADITLHEPQLQDYLLEGYGVGAGFRVEGYEGQLGGPAFGEGEEGLLEGISPELDIAIRASSAGRGSAAGSRRSGQPQWGPSSSAVGQDIDMGGFEEPFFYQDFGGGEGPAEQLQPLPDEDETAFAERVAREHEEGRARLEGAPRGSPTPLVEGDLSRDYLESGEGTPSSTTRKRVSNALDLAQAKAKDTEKTARKAKKAKLVPIDRSTELDDVLFRSMRASYADRMQAERDAAEIRKRDGEAHQRAIDLVFGPPAFLDGSGLTNFWQTTVEGQMVPFEGGKAAEEKKRRASGLPPTARKSRRTDAGAEVMRTAGERLSEQPGGMGVGAFAGEAQDFFAGHEFGGGEQYGRDYGGFEQFHFDQEVEQGRAGSAAGLTGSHRPSIVPWAAEPATSDIGGPMGFPGPSSAAGGSRVSMEAPIPGFVRRSRTPSLLHSPARAGSIEGLLAEQEGELVGFEERAFSRSPSPHRSLGAATPAVEPALRETGSLKFLGYARRQQRAGEELRFSDIVPVAETNPPTAAMALYHLLCLATKGLVKVEQDEAYGEITVDIR